MSTVGETGMVELPDRGIWARQKQGQAEAREPHLSLRVDIYLSPGMAACSRCQALHGRVKT